jgi:hypothetical protein
LPLWYLQTLLDYFPDSKPQQFTFHYKTYFNFDLTSLISQRVPEGMSMMYHAQEKINTTPVAEKSGFRGGIHNSGM